LGYQEIICGDCGGSVEMCGFTVGAEVHCYHH